MAGAATRKRARLVAGLRWRPEWPFAVGLAVVWIALLSERTQGDAALRSSSGLLFPHDAHHHHASMPWTGGIREWALMSTAMMMPAALPAVRHVGLNSIRGRRQWGMALYSVVYVGVWVVFGIIALAGERFAREILGLNTRPLLVATLIVAATWQLTRPKRRALNTCRRTVPLPPVGRKANAGCVRFALKHGRRCIVSCWALMLVMVVAGHANRLWIVVLTALITIEELTLLGRRLRWPSALLLALGACAAALGVSDSVS